MAVGSQLGPDRCWNEDDLLSWVSSVALGHHPRFSSEREGDWRGQTCIRDILIPSLGMGFFLLFDRHGIFARFSQRKITWLEVICITKLDIVCQSYTPPLPQVPPGIQTHWLCVQPSLCLPCLYKTTNYQINIPNSPHSPLTVLGRDFWNLPESKFLAKGARRVHVVVRMCICILFFVKSQSLAVLLHNDK